MNTHRRDVVRTGLALVALVLNVSVIQWTQADAFVNTGSLTNPRYHYTATCLADGRVLVAGGQNASGYLSSVEVYDPDTGAWTVTGSMSFARRNHTATLLSNGKVLVAGGFGTGGYLSSAELYDPATGAWTTTSPLPSTRYHHTATLLPNGKVLVAGGYGSGGYLSSAVLYDPATGLWANTGSLIASRRLHTATLLPNGKVLAAGGWGSAGYLSSAELYDPATEAWTSTGLMTTTRYWHTATLLANGQVLVTGGYGTGGYRASTELYNPATGTWTASGSMGTACYAHTAALLPDGKVLVGGGVNSTNSCLPCAALYDPAAGTWSSCGPMNAGRTYHAAACLHDGRVLMAAGNGVGGALAAAEFFIASAPTPTWTTMLPMPTARYSHTATLLPNGKVLVAGGYNGGAIPNAELFGPFPASPGWTGAGTMTEPRHSHTATLLPDGTVLVAGGYGTGGFVNSAELYDPDPDPGNPAWAGTGFLGNPRGYHTATLLPNGKVLVAGGYPAAGRGSSELYNPATKTWEPPVSLNYGRFEHTATLLRDGSVLVAGGDDGTGYPTFAERYVNGAWTTTGALTPRIGHTATLLANGKVLVAGGWNPSGGILLNAELYDPGLGTWSAVDTLNFAREYFTTTLLPNGSVLASAGIASSSYLSSAELFELPVPPMWTMTGSLSPPGRGYHKATLLPNGAVLVTGGSPSQYVPLDRAEVYQTSVAYSIAWLFPIEYQNQNYIGDLPPLPPNHSAGSGITYWPARNSFLVLDNSPKRLIEYTRNHVYVRTITLDGFLDPEDIHWISGNTFVISQEYHDFTPTDSIDELVIIDLPGTGDDIASITDMGVRRLQITFPSASRDNKGIEGVTRIGADFYFTTEFDPVAGPGSWNVWKVANTGSGPVAPTMAFSLPPLIANRATDISGMATDGTYLWLLSDDGAPGGPAGRILIMTTTGQLVGDYLLPNFTLPTAAGWNQPEGIELFVDPADSKMKILLTGELGGGSGVDFMLLSAP